MEVQILLIASVFEDLTDAKHWSFHCWQCDMIWFIMDCGHKNTDMTTDYLCYIYTTAGVQHGAITVESWANKKWGRAATYRRDFTSSVTECGASYQSSQVAAHIAPLIQYVTFRRTLTWTEAVICTPFICMHMSTVHIQRDVNMLH